MILEKFLNVSASQACRGLDKATMMELLVDLPKQNDRQSTNEKPSDKKLLRLESVHEIKQGKLVTEKQAVALK